jgi:UPF0755 protein
MKKSILIVLAILFLMVLSAVMMLFVPKENETRYRMQVVSGQGVSQVSRQLATDDVIYNRTLFVAAAYVLGIQNNLHTGSYRLPKKVSSWQILRRLQGASPDTITVRIPEGVNFAQMRRIINNNADLQHETLNLSEAALLKKVDAEMVHEKGEGLFFPDSYDLDMGSSDLVLYRVAYEKMKKELEVAWDERQENLPYQSPYDLLIMASLLEKETAHETDRASVAAVFVNRLNIGMRLQTDPTVIYGMGSAYQGKIRRSDLRRDTPYNTYTRGGLTPTPISMPSKAALEAAGHPANEKYLYFVSRMDNTGLSQFSHNLDEHNAAVRKYILKRK